MSVHAAITLKKEVSDLDQADDWFEEIRIALQGKTTCRMNAQSSNREPAVELTEEPDNG